MFGTFRVILAVMVLLTHVFVGQQPFVYGVSAVVGFFIISGYVMTILIKNSFGKIGKSTFYFYIDRFIRIYPQYFLFLVLTQIADLLWSFNDYFLHTTPTIWKFFLNALIVPVNYYLLLTDSISQYLPIPQAWSLGLEEQFYWIFPFIVLIPWCERFTAAISFIIYVIAVFGFIDTELFAWRLLPGMIFIFLLGKNLAEYNRTKNEESFWTMTSLYVATIMLTIGLWLFRPDILYSHENKEVLLGIIFSFPIIAYLSRLPRRKWDEFLGQSSYGIFLCHRLVLNMLSHFNIFTQNITSFITASIVISMALGFAGYYLVERLVTPFRYALRRRHAQSLQS